VILCKEARELLDNPEYVAVIAKLVKQVKKLAPEWERVAMKLVDSQFGCLHYATLQSKVDKQGVLRASDSRTSQKEAYLDFNSEM
jgi:hypothetical protein